jgi:protein-tyrosine phosphatase
MTRTLAWEGLLNVRDLGGHPTADGGETRWGAVVRADNVRRLTEAGWQALVDYGVRTVVDLRFHEELAEDPPRELPVDVVHVSLFGELDPEYGAELQERERTAPDWGAHLRELYLESLEHLPANFAQAVAAVGDASDGGVCVHCFAGKDRTGLVSALVLRLAGVPIDVIADDYAASEANVARLIEPWAAEARDEVERERRLRHALTPREAMHGALTELERRHGDVRAYLETGGASAEALDRVRVRLR